MIESKLIPRALFSDKSVKSVNNLKDYAGIEYIASMNQTHSDVVTFVKSPAVYDSDGIIQKSQRYMHSEKNWIEEICLKN